ncbi:MAG: hypothetical protein M3238_01065 [Actinomycetota bacterium]|nr:hypothetical protein [Actinomycetota bacterium]
MKAKALIAVVMAGLIAGALLAPMSAGAAPAKATTVGTDADGDWGENADPTLAPLGDALGQDLTAASISSDGKNVNFIITVNSLPPTGGMPEFTRYTWNFRVGKKDLEIDGKFTNYSRGICDPTAASCPPPRDPGMRPFFLRGECGPNDLVVTTFTACKELAKLQGEFDAAAGTISVSVPFKALGVKRGSTISPGTNIFGGSISAAPSAFVTSSAFPLDTMVVTKTFVVK